MTNLTYVVTAHTLEYFYECMLGFAAQSDKNFNLVVSVDNHINHDLITEIRKLAMRIKCNDIQVVEISGNGFAGVPRNYGYSLAKTKWITYVDGDDFIDPESTELINKTIESLDDTYTFITTGAGQLDRYGIIHYSEDEINYDVNKDIYFSFRQVQKADMTQLQIITKSNWEKYPYLNDKHSEDRDFAMHQFLLGKHFRIKKPLYIYRIHNSKSLVHSKDFSPNDIVKIRFKESNYYQDLYNRRDINISAI